jgi:hypothetical protein
MFVVPPLAIVRVSAAAVPAAAQNAAMLATAITLMRSPLPAMFSFPVCFAPRPQRMSNDGCESSTL